MSLDKIKEGALKLKALRETKESLTQQLKEVNESISELEEHELDSLMTDEGISEIVIDDVKIKRGVIFRGSSTSSDSKDDFQYLFDTHNDGALKKKLIIDLDKVPDAESKVTNMGLDYSVNYSIHHMTLSGLIGDLVEEGQMSTEDLSKYRIYAQPRIKVEMKK